MKPAMLPPPVNPELRKAADLKAQIVKPRLIQLSNDSLRDVVSGLPQSIRTGSSGGGVSDHGALTGLTDDDHTQYALLAGRSGGQELKGGNGSGDDLTLTSTSDATKGDVIVQDGSVLKHYEQIDGAEISAPASPAAGRASIYHSAGVSLGSNTFMKGDTGTVSHLGQYYAQTFRVAQDVNTATSCNLQWEYVALPGAAGAATVNYASTATWQAAAASGDVLSMTASYGSWSWLAVKNAGGLTQSYVNVGAAVQRFAGDLGTTAMKAARVHVRMASANKDYLDSAKLVLNDSAGTPNENATALNLSVSLANFSSSWIDISSWTGAALRVGVNVYGKAHTVNGNYVTSVSIEWLAIELIAE